MGQVEVYEILKAKRLNGDHRFFSKKNIEGFMRDKGYSNGMIQNVNNNLTALWNSKHLELKMTDDFRDWRRLFRIKDKYINGGN